MRNKRKKVAMFVFNNGNHDQRVHKQAQALGRLGYKVRVYCFLTAGQKPREKRDGYLLLREDQRSHQARFFDDQIMGRLRKKRDSQESESVKKLVMPPDREPERPCAKPQRELRPNAPKHEKDHWSYIERINRVWAKRAKRWKPDLVQAHDLDALRAATLLGQELDIPVIYDTHELWSEQPFIDSQEAVDYWDALERELIKVPDLVMTVNEPLAEILEEKYDFKGVLALHNCQELQSVQNRPPNKKPLALYQGTYVPHRGLEQVIAAASKLDSVEVAFRGFGVSENELRALDTKKKIKWLDPVPGPDVVQAASCADIGLIPFLPTCLNHYYSTPNKLFEYMSAGLAVCGSDIPEISRFVKEYQLGNLFDPYAPNDIADALHDMATSGQLQEQRQRAAENAQSRWNWEAEVERYLMCVKSLLS